MNDLTDTKPNQPERPSRPIKMSFTPHDASMLALAERHATPQASVRDGMRYAMRSIENADTRTGILLFVYVVMTFLVGLVKGIEVVLLVVSFAVAVILACFIVKTATSRSKIDEENLWRMSGEARRILDDGLLEAHPSSAEHAANMAMRELADDRRPNRAAIRRRAVTSMVAIRCLHARTMSEIDESHRERATDEARRALREVRDEALRAIVPLQDQATDLLAERLDAVVGRRPLAEQGPSETTPQTGHPRFDDLVRRVQERIALGDEPENAAGYPVAPLLYKHLPALMDTYRAALREGGDERKAQSLLHRSLDAMAASLEEALARPMPTARSAMEGLDTMARFHEARSDATLRS